MCFRALGFAVQFFFTTYRDDYRIFEKVRMLITGHLYSVKPCPNAGRTYPMNYGRKYFPASLMAAISAVWNPSRLYASVFSHSPTMFSPRSLCPRLRLARDSSRFRFINTIKFSKAHPNLDAAITQLAYSNLRLQSLHLSEQTHFPKEAMALLGQRMGRTMTSLSCVRFDDFGDADLEIVADSFQYLQKLDIQGDYDGGGQVTDQGILVISIKLNCLLSLNIRGNKKLSNRALDYLSSNSLLLGELTAEFFEKFPVGLDKVCSFSSLFSFNIEGVDISEKILGTLSKAELKLRILHLLFPEPKGLIQGTTVCRFFKSLPLLNELFLKRFKFTSDITATDFSLSIPNIEVLIFHDSDFPSRAARECTLFQILKSCRLLKVMSICCSSLGYSNDWINMPLLCQQLRRLELYSCNGLDDAILNCICKICPNLEAVEIDGGSSSFTEKGIEAVIDRWVNLKSLYVISSKIPKIDWEKCD